MECLKCSLRSLPQFNRQTFSNILTKRTPQLQTRFESSSRRTRKALRIRPDSSHFQEEQTQDYIVHNPPSSAPNVYHTPEIFLPSSDPRRTRATTTNETASIRTETDGKVDVGTASGISELARGKLGSKQATGLRKAQLPNALPTRTYTFLKRQLPIPERQGYVIAGEEKRYHLTKEDVEQIRRLRGTLIKEGEGSDGEVWTVSKLARKYGCSPVFIQMCVQNQKGNEDMKTEREKVMGRWGRAKRESREERGWRKARWGLAD